MTIRKNIAFSLLFHSFLLILTVLSAHHIMSGERIVFFVELKDNPGTGQHQNEGDRPKRVHDTPARKIAQNDEPLAPLRNKRQDQTSETKSTSEEHHPGPPENQPSHEKAEEALGSVQEKSGYGSGETQSSSAAASSGEHAAANTAGVTLIELQSGGGGGNSQGKSIIGQIKASIERAKTYPTLARKMRQEGTVIAEFSINPKGLPQNIQIVKSSGFSLLDSATRDTILKASPFPVIKGTIEVPLTFILKTE